MYRLSVTQYITLMILTTVISLKDFVNTGVKDVQL